MMDADFIFYCLRNLLWGLGLVGAIAFAFWLVYILTEETRPCARSWEADQERDPAAGIKTPRQRGYQKGKRCSASDCQRWAEARGRHTDFYWCRWHGLSVQHDSKSALIWFNDEYICRHCGNSFDHVRGKTHTDACEGCLERIAGDSGPGEGDTKGGESC